MDKEQVRQALEVAARMLVDKDALLLTRNANERTLTHRLAIYLERDVDTFAGWYVDCEYNRDGAAAKRLPAPEQIMSDDTSGRTVFPDIIVHKRIPFTECKNDEKRRVVNLVVIEAKKDATPTERDLDRRKLQEIKAAFLYQFAVFVNLHVDEKANPRWEIEFV